MGRSSKTACLLAFSVWTAASSCAGATVIAATAASAGPTSRAGAHRQSATAHRPVVVRGGAIQDEGGERRVRPSINGTPTHTRRDGSRGDQVALGVFDGTGAFNSAGIIDQPDLLSNGFLNGLPIPPPREPIGPPPFANGPDSGFLGGPGYALPPYGAGRRTDATPACPLIIKVGRGLRRTVPTKVIYGRRHCT